MPIDAVFYAPKSALLIGAETLSGQVNNEDNNYALANFVDGVGVLSSSYQRK